VAGEYLRHPECEWDFSAIPPGLPVEGANHCAAVVVFSLSSAAIGDYLLSVEIFNLPYEFKDVIE
jgi:hypothetical protein